MQKVLFLDVDGVLNNPEILEKNGLGIGPDHLTELKRIINETGAKIVLSSTWRLMHHTRVIILPALQSIGADVIGMTPNHKNLPRSEEILTWLENNPECHFAILDDDSDAGLGFEENFFQTEFQFGLTPQIANRIIEFFDC